MSKGGSGGGYAGAGGGGYLTGGASGGSAKPINYGNPGALGRGGYPMMGGQQYPMMNGTQGMPGMQGQGMQGIYFMITDGKQTYEGIIMPFDLYNGKGGMPGSSIDGKLKDYDTRMALPPAGGEMYDPMKDPKAQGGWLKQYLSSLGIGGGKGKANYDAEGSSIDGKVKDAPAGEKKPNIFEKYRMHRKEKEMAYSQDGGQSRRSGQQATGGLERKVDRESLPLAV